MTRMQLFLPSSLIKEVLELRLIFSHSWVVTSAVLSPDPVKRPTRSSIPASKSAVAHIRHHCPLDMFLWPTHVESCTCFWAKDLNEEALLSRLEEVHEACIMRGKLGAVPVDGEVYGGLMPCDNRFHRVQVDFAPDF